NRGRWPMKLSDYMVSGRPVVSTAVGDLRPLFTGEHPIGLVARDEAAEFAAQTLYLLANPELGHGLGENGRFLAETQFNGRRIAASLEQFYYRCSAE
ncbi:MAG: glycosyltransferase, partial [Anaerolineales bacterium]|nr:glycosyltransferase [Anaerolineales bacterium]